MSPTTKIIWLYLFPTPVKGAMFLFTRKLNLINKDK